MSSLHCPAHPPFAQPNPSVASCLSTSACQGGHFDRSAHMSGLLYLWTSASMLLFQTPVFAEHEGSCFSRSRTSHQVSPNCAKCFPLVRQSESSLSSPLSVEWCPATGTGFLPLSSSPRMCVTKPNKFHQLLRRRNITCVCAQPREGSV
ncbi:hypothetical protein BCV69DRAFT_127413 [Microstroma glucosiphilum]|uniref:Uncharacterized protein n=1 Tax=Pseudomicrostroma glucosiphilum TaxID=1684307 RepID=A0A316TZF9_9BASI|nr:hypothetical protein BCV69DRAFT_127413 [Pseudomicrostroma glucosiphilum]PWN17711.1 hypothetical protein BCV69DRAFT_127413 [Pseudomicrostroma glucosiphilum]